MNQNNNGNQNAGQWSQIIDQVLDKLSGTNMSTTVGFDHLEVDIPRAKGPDCKDLGSAKWVVNGKYYRQRKHEHSNNSKRFVCC
jgi:hypothetical protein